MKSYLNPRIIRGLIAVLKMGAENEAGWAVFANARWRADSWASIRLCSLNWGLHKRANEPHVDQRRKQKYTQVYDANTGLRSLLLISLFWRGDFWECRGKRAADVTGNILFTACLSFDLNLSPELDSQLLIRGTLFVPDARQKKYYISRETHIGIFYRLWQ